MLKCTRQNSGLRESCEKLTMLRIQIWILNRVLNSLTNFYLRHWITMEAIQNTVTRGRLPSFILRKDLQCYLHLIPSNCEFPEVQIPCPLGQHSSKWKFLRTDLSEVPLRFWATDIFWKLGTIHPGGIGQSKTMLRSLSPSIAALLWQ